jgi:chromosome segregation ATPase
VAALALTASACGGAKTTSSTTTGTSATVQWANGVCSAFSTWKASLESIKSSFKNAQPTKSNLRRVERQVEQATTKLARSLKQLGTPNTAAGQQAKKTLQRLSTQFSKNVNKIQQALKATPSSAANALATLSTVSATLATMAQNLSLAAANLKQANVKGEVQQAFKQAPACKAFFAS